MRRLLAWGSSGLLLLTGLHGVAQEKTNELDPVTITAGMTPERVSRTGRNIFVISGERFSGLPVSSIDELLRFLPGVEMQMRGPMGAQSDIVLRGGTFQQVLVILDGVRLNDPNTGHFSSYIPIAPAEIERIEILKGASSAVYGSEAVGGVIHIITKTYASKKGVRKATVQAHLARGEYGLLNGGGGGYFSNGQTGISIGVLSNNASGQRQRGINGFFNNHTGSVSFQHFVSNRLQVAFRTAYDKRDFAAQNFYTPLVIDTATEKVETFWNQLQVAYTAARHTVRIQAGYKRLNDTYLLNRNFTANTNRSSLYQALLSDEWKVGSTTTLLTGTQVINKMIRSNDRGDHNVSQAAFFAVLNQQWGHLFVSPAARVEWNERSGWELIPQVNLSYRVAQWQLRASAGKTTRDADFTERFNNYNRPMVNSGGRIGNADLEAERSFSYEAGADYFLASSLKISGTFFRRHHTNLIDYVTTSYADMPRKSNLQVNGTYLLARNVAEVTTTGVETDIQFTKNWGKSGLWASTGFIWLNSKTSDAVPSLYLASHARYQVNFSAQYTHKWFAFGINGLFKERAEQASANANITKVDKEYVVLNAKLEGFVLPGKVSAFIQADNLFDRSYTDLLGSRMPGRWWMGGIKILLSK